MHCRKCNAAVNDIIVQRLHSSRLLCSVISSFLKRVSFGMRSLIVPRKLVRSKLIGLCFLFRQTSFTLVICLNYFPFEVKMRTYNGIMPPPPGSQVRGIFSCRSPCVRHPSSLMSKWLSERNFNGRATMTNWFPPSRIPTIVTRHCFFSHRLVLESLPEGTRSPSLTHKTDYHFPTALANGFTQKGPRAGGLSSICCDFEK